MSNSLPARNANNSSLIATYTTGPSSVHATQLISGALFQGSGVRPTPGTVVQNVAHSFGDAGRR